ncbi:MAG: hypothetical protein Q7L55_08500 [Actinomycetota bacterium]|nr:hypothetical protein [Actinomycetota bacterium]
MTVDAICELTGLSANSVRRDLEVLIAGESVSRESAETHRRGRPSWLYRLAERPASLFQALAEALSAELSRGGDPSMAARAAEYWTHSLPALSPSDSPDQAVEEVSDALNRLGFDATESELGDSISITSCQYLKLADANPVICEIHFALVERLLQQTGQPVTAQSLDVSVRPGVCVVHLNRLDLVPVRVITHKEVDTRSEGNAL